MNNIASDSSLPCGSAPGEGRQIDEQADRNVFVSSGKQNVANEPSHDGHVTESLDAGQLRHDSEAVEGNEVSELSLSRELRALVTSMSSLNIGGIDGGSAHPSPMPLVPINTTSPHAELLTTTPLTSTSPPLTPEVHRASVASVPSSPNAGPEPAPVVASASSEPSPNPHPTFAAPPEEAALVEMAPVLATETDDANATLSPQPAPSSSPNTTSTSSGSPIPAYIQPPCGHQECGRAAERIRAINRAFAATDRDMAAHPQASTQDLARAADAAYEVLSHCERYRTIVVIRKCLVLLHRMGASSQGLHVPFYALCGYSGIHPATVPALTGVPLPRNWPQVWHMQGVGQAAGANVA